MRGAAARIFDRQTIRFPRRAITRAADPRFEDNVEISESEFAALSRPGKCALSWRAHGLGYSISSAVFDDISAGHTVVFNASRSIIGDARTRFANVRVILVTAPAPFLAKRLAERSRENADDIIVRLKRGKYVIPGDIKYTTIINDRSIEEGVNALTAAIEGLVV